MDIESVPAPLRERLGPGATGGLVHLLELSHREGREDVIATCTDRFERRLGEEVAGLRVQIAQTEAVLRQDMSETGAAIRQEMVQMGADIRREMVQMGADIRGEMGQLGADIRGEMGQLGAEIRGEMGQMGSNLRHEISSGRVEILKWCFLFWIGQVVALSSIFGIMLRFSR